MKIENQVRAFAGSFILASLALYHFHSHKWLWFTAFVGANLLQSAFTGFCPLEILLRKIQEKTGTGNDRKENMKTTTMQHLSTLVGKLPKDELILDVRTPEEFAEGHVPGSRNIPHEEVGKHAAELKKYKAVYLHCRSGKRAQVAHAALVSQGATNLVCVNGGGMLDWAAAGYPIEK